MPYSAVGGEMKLMVVKVQAMDVIVIFSVMEEKGAEAPYNFQYGQGNHPRGCIDKAHLIELF